MVFITDLLNRALYVAMRWVARPCGLQSPFHPIPQWVFTQVRYLPDGRTKDYDKFRDLRITHVATRFE